MLTADDARRLVRASGRRHEVHSLDVARATRLACAQEGFDRLPPLERAGAIIVAAASVGETFCVLDGSLLAPEEWRQLAGAGFTVPPATTSGLRTVSWHLFWIGGAP